MKKQIYLCVDLKTYTQDAFMHPMEGRKGTLLMTEENEKFFFMEAVPERKSRNTKAWTGGRINVILTKDNRYKVTLRALELNEATDACAVADEIFAELEQAKEALSL